MDPDSPRLPPELERLIFELAVQLHRPLAATLARVASRVKDWVEAELYRVAIIQEGIGDNLALLFKHRFPFKAGHALQDRPHRLLDTRAIIIWDGSPEKYEDTVFQHATHLEEIALWREDPNSAIGEEGLAALSHLPIRKLSVASRKDLEILFSPSRRLLLFDTLTHLSVVVFNVTRDMLVGISACHNLTHLALNFTHGYWRESDLATLFEAHRCLDVLVLAFIVGRQDEDPDVTASGLYPLLPSHMSQRIVCVALDSFFHCDAWIDDVEEAQGIFGYADAIIRQRAHEADVSLAVDYDA
ncbi:hypothetical protein FB107DRAFT_268114 [Schizophyllum commune]